jgi:hypothetical protein
MMATKLNAQVIDDHQEPPEYAREIPPTHGGAEKDLIEILFIKLNLTSRAYQTKLSPLKDGTGVSGLGPPARQGTTHGRTFRQHHRVAVVVEPWDGQDPRADST